MRISGHKSRSMFDRYDITDERDIQIAGQKLARYLEGKAEVVTKEVTDVELGGRGNRAKCNEISILNLAPQVGFEPTTLRLTAEAEREPVRSRARQCI